jgi:hypothetical protein
MQVFGLMVLTLIGMALVAGVSVALYASLPQSLLECAELHGRFRGLQRDVPLPDGTPMNSMPEGALTRQAA